MQSSEIDLNKGSDSSKTNKQVSNDSSSQRLGKAVDFLEDAEKDLLKIEFDAVQDIVITIRFHKEDEEIPSPEIFVIGFKRFLEHSKKFVETGRLSFEKLLSNGVLRLEDGKKSEGSDSKEVKLEGVDYPLLPSYIDVIFKEKGKTVVDKDLNNLILRTNPMTVKIQSERAESQKRINTQVADDRVDKRSWYRFKKMLYKFSKKPLSHYTVESIDDAYTDIKNNSTGLEDYALKIKQELAGTLTTSSYDLPKGILFYGPPRTGKTFTSKRLIASLDLFRIHDDLAAGDFNKPLQGQSEEMINKIANRCDVLPWELCTVFIDEIDGLFPNRMTAGASGSKIDMISIFLSQMDGNKKKVNLFVVGTSNRLKQMDAAFLQRMDIKLFLGLPNSKSRASWVKMISAKYSNKDNKPYAKRIKDIFENHEDQLNLQLNQEMLRYTMNFTADAMKKSFSQIVQSVINAEKIIGGLNDEELRREIKRIAVKDLDRICDNDKIFISSYTPPSIMVALETLKQANYFDSQFKWDMLVRGNDKLKTKRMLIDVNEAPEEQFQVEIQGVPQKVPERMVNLLNDIEKNLKAFEKQKPVESPWEVIARKAEEIDQEYFNQLKEDKEAYEYFTKSFERKVQFQEFFKQYYTLKTSKKKEQERKVLDTFGLGDRSLSDLTKGEIFSILCEMAQRANLNYVCVIDSNYFRNLGLTTDDKMAQEIKGVTDEALQYESSMVIFDLDSVADITKNFSDLRSDIIATSGQASSKDSPSFSYEINYPMAFRASLEMFNTITKKEKNNWLVAVSASNKLSLDLKEKTDWPLTKKIQELEDKIDRQSLPIICGNCCESYKEKDNSDNECAKHFSEYLYDELEYQRNKLKSDLEASVKQIVLEASQENLIIKPDNVWSVTKLFTKKDVINFFIENKRGAKERHNLGRFKWMCCNKSYFEKGEIKCRHVPMDSDLANVLDSKSGNSMIQEDIRKTTGAPPKLRYDIVVQDISKMSIQAADALISSCDPDLACDGPLSGTIKKYAGSAYEAELTKLRKDGIKLKSDTVVTTTSGNLKCKKIIHTVAPEFDAKLFEESQLKLQQVIENCLEEANKIGCATILLPLIGAGSGYELNVWWKIATNAFDSFSQKRFGFPPNLTTLTKVIVIDRDLKNIEILNRIAKEK